MAQLLNGSIAQLGGCLRKKTQWFSFGSWRAIFMLLLAPIITKAQNGKDPRDGVLIKQEIYSGDKQFKNYFNLLQNKRIALIINQTSMVDEQSLLDILVKSQVHITKIFVPEHGFRGQSDAGGTVNNAIDSATGIPIVSLYGKNNKPTKDQLSDIDVVIYDLQDVGARFYTYISTLQYAMEACAENSKQFIVLDRPDPNGFYVDGPLLDTSFRSFVGMQPIPVVYGMTAGEYANMLVGERWFHDADKLDLTVIPCVNYNHKMKYTLPVPPSPNLKTMAAIYAYPSLCFFEGTVISVGRGTDKPFQQWGNPELGGSFSYSFTPTSTTGAAKPLYENKTCYGELVAKDEAEALQATNYRLFIGWLMKAYNAYPEKDKFFNSFFDKLAGNKILKEQIIKEVSEAEIYDSWRKGLVDFKKVRRKYLLYEDFE